MSAAPPAGTHTVFTFWFLREYYLAVDSHVYIGFLGPIVDVLATFVLTSLALLLVWSVKAGEREINAANFKSGKWLRRGIWIYAYFAILLLAQLVEVAIVGVVQAIIFYIPFFVKLQPWKKFEIRDIMIATLLIGCAIAVLLKMQTYQWLSFKSPVSVGIVFGMLSLLAWRIMGFRSGLLKCMIAILFPYIAILTIILMLGRSNKQMARIIQGALISLTFAPMFIAIGILSFNHAKPCEIGSGKNVIMEIVSIGDEIGDIFQEAPPYPNTGPFIRPFPKNIAQMKRVVNAYSPMVNKSRALAAEPAWLSVNYDWDWRNPVDRGDRCFEMSALSNLSTVMLVEAQLAFKEHRREDGLQCFSDVLNLNRQCGSGGLPSSTEGAMSRDHYMMEKFAMAKRRLEPAQATAFATRLLEQCDAYESIEIVMERRLAWEDRVPNWHQRLALKYLDYHNQHPRRSHLSYSYSLHQTQLKLLALELLIDAYQKSNGKFPDSLNDLQFKDIDSLTSDPFSTSDASFTYELSGGKPKVVGVGPNGIDDQGSGDDLTFSSIRTMFGWAD